MPLCFAYGANMDVKATRQRCPASHVIGPAKLVGYRFFIMSSGWASVQPSRPDAVHGLLWSLALSDVPALDRFEDVGNGLYRKQVLPVIRTTGAAASALVYIGCTDEEGVPRSGYLEAILAAASQAGLPEPYIKRLSSYGGRTSRKTTDADDPAKPMPQIRARYATPLDPGRN